ncbi:MAG: hypothetical protein HGA45_27940 [Chloroflexales bacterium]|nr:hypothetical protein [Chloroflexales bacterium]
MRTRTAIGCSSRLRGRPAAILRALVLPTAQALMPARALSAAGAMLRATGGATEARQLLDEALAIGRAVGGRLNTGWALLHLGA